MTWCNKQNWLLMSEIGQTLHLPQRFDFRVRQEQTLVGESGSADQAGCSRRYAPRHLHANGLCAYHVDNVLRAQEAPAPQDEF